LAACTVRVLFCCPRAFSVRRDSDAQQVCWGRGLLLIMVPMPTPEDLVLTPDQINAVDSFWRSEAPRLAAAVRDLPWAGGVEAREALANVVEAERSRQGFLTKDTFDAVLTWGFGRASGLEDADIRTATRDAFTLLGSGDQEGAVQRLRQLRGVGVSRATKLLALSDQKNLGIYDSHAAAALSLIRDGDKPLVAVPPGKSPELRGGPSLSQERLAQEFPKYTAVLRRLLENAQHDEKYGRAFERVADVERSLFASHRGAEAASPDRGQAVGAPAPVSGIPGVARAAFVGAAPGAVADLPSLVRGAITVREYGKRRARAAGLSSAANAVARQAERVGKAATGTRAHLQGGARSAAVSVVVGGIAEAAAVVRGEVRLRDYTENRILDAADAGGGRVAAGLAVTALAAAPFEAPAIVTGVVVFGTGAAVSRAVRPIRRRVARVQHARGVHRPPGT
jgi:hypothetical protein